MVKLTDGVLCFLDSLGSMAFARKISSAPSVLDKSGFSPQLHQKLLIPVLQEQDSSSTRTSTLSTSDEFLLRAIESAKSSTLGKDKNLFEIKRDGEMIHLRRVYQDEIITCEVSDVHDIFETKHSLVVTSQIAGEGSPIMETQGVSHGITLSINCMISGGYWSKIKIEHLTIHHGGHRYSYQGEDLKFSELDRDMQRSLKKYLEARGIKSSILKHILKYKKNIESIEDTKWLEDLEDFIMLPATSESHHSELSDANVSTFKIEKSIGRIIMTRSYHGETIEVSAETWELDWNLKKRHGVKLEVKMWKDDRMRCLDFVCRTTGSSRKKLKIKCLTTFGIRSKKISEVGKNLRNSLREYLKARGITSKIIKDMHEYRSNKAKEVKMNLMKDIKKFLK